MYNKARVMIIPEKEKRNVSSEKTKKSRKIKPISKNFLRNLTNRKGRGEAIEQKRQVNNKARMIIPEKEKRKVNSEKTKKSRMIKPRSKNAKL